MNNCSIPVLDLLLIIFDQQSNHVFFVFFFWSKSKWQQKMITKRPRWNPFVVSHKKTGTALHVVIRLCYWSCFIQLFHIWHPRAVLNRPHRNSLYVSGDPQKLFWGSLGIFEFALCSDSQAHVCQIINWAVQRINETDSRQKEIHKKRKQKERKEREREEKKRKE